MASRVLLTVGTRKGAWLFHGDGARRNWRLDGPHFLGHIFNHVMLEPPSYQEQEDLAHRESIVDFDHLLGHRGQATTQLIPSGKALFGSELVDVIADGEVISRGAQVVVVEVHGNRVVVRSAGDQA